MVKKFLLGINICAVATINVISAAHVVRSCLKELAEKETVSGPREYILVRFARGDYLNLGGFEAMKRDYKFYEIVSKFDER